MRKLFIRGYQGLGLELQGFKGLNLYIRQVSKLQLSEKERESIREVNLSPLSFKISLTLSCFRHTEEERGVVSFKTNFRCVQ